MNQLYSSEFLDIIKSCKNYGNKLSTSIVKPLTMSIQKRYLIVENDHASLSGIIEEISAVTGSADFKVALNGGHAYLHLDHLHLNGKLYSMELVIILNMHTPLSNGFEFLNMFKANCDFPKERIRIMVLKEKLSEQELDQLKSFNVELVSRTSLRSVINTSNSPAPEPENEEVYQPVPEPNIRRRGFKPGHARAG